jgi:uncharacterized membrane protein YcaP (DUF421 family)
VSILGIYLGFTVFVLFIIFGSLIGEGASKKKISEVITGILGFIITGIMFIYAVSEYHEPKAIEVYQGKTTLEYKVKDGVKVDSVVVYRNVNK